MRVNAALHACMHAALYIKMPFMSAFLKRGCCIACFMHHQHSMYVTAYTFCLHLVAHVHVARMHLASPLLHHKPRLERSNFCCHCVLTDMRIHQACMQTPRRLGRLWGRQEASGAPSSHAGPTSPGHPHALQMIAHPTDPSASLLLALDADGLDCWQVRFKLSFSWLQCVLLGLPQRAA